MDNPSRKAIVISGLVQGVGFRPFVYRLAKELGLAGTVANTAKGVVIHVQGPALDLDVFYERVLREKPAVSHVQHSTCKDIPALPGEIDFIIISSNSTDSKSVAILPDLATCPDCLADVAQPDGRRHNYAFTNCTNCGPRFSIINDIPYDRPNTEMRNFIQCPACMAEYTNPTNRRFHAQPNA